MWWWFTGDSSLIIARDGLVLQNFASLKHFDNIYL